MPKCGSQTWGIARQHWLDLSTGINPLSWPVPEIPAHLWQRLPEADDGLNEIIRHSYAAPAHADCEPVAGSAAIMALPRLRQPCHVGIPLSAIKNMPTIGDRLDTTLSQSAQSTPMPRAMNAGWMRWTYWCGLTTNNPTGELIPTATLLRWHARLAATRRLVGCRRSIYRQHAAVQPVRSQWITGFADSALAG